MDDYSNSPSFEVIEEIKVNHGMFISTRQVAETFFHQTVPSQTVKVHQNPVMMMNNFSIEKADVQIRSENRSSCSFSFFRKFKYVASAILSMVELVLVHLYFGGYLEEEKVEGELAACCSDNVKNKRRSPAGRMKSISDRKKQVSLVINTNSAFSRSTVGIFLTISLALCTMWANHIN